MTLQRSTSPLPEGRYWMVIQDLPEGQIADFDQWLRDVSGSVTVESSDLDKDSDPKSEFILFQVTGPGAFLEAKQFGFPNIADSDIKTRDDAIQAEKIDTPGVEDLLEGTIKLGKLAAYLTIGVVLFKALRK